MKKEDIYSLIVYGLMVGIALFVGLEIIAPAFRQLGIVGAAQYGYAIITILGGFLLNAFLLEFGHLLGALVGGYNIKSINVLGLSLTKTNNQWIFAIKPFEGLTGETIVSPRSTQSKPTLNLWGGLILYVVEVVVAFYVAYYVFTEEQWGRYASIVIIAIGGMLMMYNFMPFKMDTITDGYRLTTVTQGKGNEAFNELVRIEKAYEENQDPKPFKQFKELNTLTVQVLLHEIYDQLLRLDYNGAMININKIMNTPKLGESMINQAFAMKTYVDFMQTTEEGRKEIFYNLSSRERKYIANDSHMMTITTYLIVAGTIEDSFSESVFCYDRKPTALQRVHEKNIRHIQDQLFARVLEMVQSKHKDWKF
jgi:hypothetical protein